VAQQSSEFNLQKRNIAHTVYLIKIPACICHLVVPASDKKYIKNHSIAVLFLVFGRNEKLPFLAIIYCSVFYQLIRIHSDAKFISFIFLTPRAFVFVKGLMLAKGWTSTLNM